MRKLPRALSVAVVLSVAGVGLAAMPEFFSDDSATLSGGTSLVLDAPPDALGSGGQTAAVKAESAALRDVGPAYGSKGWSGWTVTLAAAHDFKSTGHYGVAGGVSTFLADRLEVGGELGGWYFNQHDDTGGVSAVIDLKWHFWMSEDRRWSIFGQGRIGMLAAFDDVPDGGTSFNFMPGAGLGVTYALDDSAARLIGGLRWHHVSNARITGDGDNPAFDSVLLYVGLTWPF